MLNRVAPPISQLLLLVTVLPASLQDCEVAPQLLASSWQNRLRLAVGRAHPGNSPIHTACIPQ